MPARREVFAAIGSIAIGHPLGTRLTALVIRCRLVMSAVSADVEVGTAAITGLPEAHTFPGREGKGGIAGEAAHSLSVRHGRRRVKPSQHRSVQ